MIDIKKYTKIVLFLFILASPSSLLAATNTGSYNEGSLDSGESREERFRQYRRQSSELQKKIEVLDDDAVENVPMPVLFGVGLNNISPNFGDPRSGGRTHEGEDIMAVKGTPIVSPTEAVVIRTGVGPSEGNYVYTANPGGETFVYMHLDEIGEDVENGTVLEEGDLIGYVGNTGNASGGAAHLHFEIHNDSNDPVDPFPRLTDEFSIEEKIKYLEEILDQSSDEDSLVEFLVRNFRSTFIFAKNENIVLPQPIIDELGIINTNPGSNGGSPLLLSRNLYLGISGDDVRALQVWLNNNGFAVSQSGAGSIGNETKYFGPATRAAVIRFQIANNISPAIGYVGAITRGVLD